MLRLSPDIEFTSVRAFKSAWFSKVAAKARISDTDLCEALSQAHKEQADDLGGDVFKKRLNNNMHRSIILAKAGRIWVYEYLFAKKDRSDISAVELAGFRNLAKAYGVLTVQQLDHLL